MKIGVVGFGNMASALIYGICEYSNFECEVLASAKNYENLVKKTVGYNIKACKSNEEVVENSDFIIMAVKPYYLEDVVKPLVDLLKGKCVYSVVAGYDFDKLKSLFDSETRILASIPNTPVRVGKGVIVCDDKTDFAENEMKFFEETFGSIALIEYVDSSLLSSAGLITGCSPAFVDLFTEALSDAAVMHGIPRALSYKLVSSTIEGSAKLQKETGEHPGVLKDKVCSPKGSTIRGVASLEKNAFRYSLIEAVNAILGK